MQSIKSTSFLSKNTADQYLTNNLLAISAAVVVASALVLFPEVSEAASAASTNLRGGKELGIVYDNIRGLIEGVVGKTIACISLAYAGIGCVLGFKPSIVAGAFGTSFTMGLGPTAIDSIVGATF